MTELNPKRRPGTAATLLLVVLVAAGVRVAGYAVLGDGPLRSMHHWTESDMHFFRSWGREIAAGDLLSRESGRPTHSWHDNFAREVHRQMESSEPYGPEIRRRLWDRWLGGARFYQDPLYPYLLAAAFLLFGDHTWPVLLAQALCGIASAALVWHVTRLLFDRRAALAAGLMAALFGPLLLYENLLLRASAITVTTLAFIAAGVHALRPGSGRRWSLLAGALAGLSVLLKSSALLLLGVLLLLLIHAHRKDGRKILTRAALCLAGFAMAFAPLAARNLAVGVSPTSMAASGPVTFINHNAADYSAMAGDRTSELASGILHRTGGRFLPSIVETVRTHESTAAWLSLLWRKQLSFWHQFEIPNNASYDYFRISLGPLAWLLVGFPLIAPLAVAGMLVSAFRSHGHLLMTAHLATGLLMAVAFYSLSRFRVPVAVALTPFAGYAVAAGWRFLKDRRWSALGVGATLVAAVALLVMRPMPDGRPRIRVADYGVANEISLHLARRMEARGDESAALDLLEDQISLAPGELLALKAGEGRSKVPAQAALLAGSFRPLHEEAARLAARVERPDEAAGHFRRARTLGKVQAVVDQRESRP